jgi:hypothetical protein
MTYSDKAFEIVKRSINSAVFIDEKALEFYSAETPNPQIIEHKLSTDLYKSFKSEGVSLAVHKFQNSDLSNDNLKRYLLKGRDLVLLDWELEEKSGIEHALKLLSEIVQYPHINFCCIYTSTAKFDDIAHHISSYFSGLSQSDFDKIVDTYSFLGDDFLEQALTAINSKGSEQINDVFSSQYINRDDFPVQFANNSDLEILKAIYYALSRYEKSDKQEYAVLSITTSSKCIIINNTFILILKKDIDNDTKPAELIKRISDELIKSENKNSFVQLLGLEMQTIFNENESFINENLLNSSTEAFFTHRNYLKKKNKTDIPFNSLIKKVLVEHATLKLRTSKLSLLESSFLDAESANYSKVPSDVEIAMLNTFYNSVNVCSLKNIDFPNVNFGDVFIDKQGYYYLCITALCDCLRPEKIKSIYDFAVGKEITIETANRLGDSAFISYITNKAINWVNGNFLHLEDITENETDKRIKKLEKRIVDLEQHQYRPVYIQPHKYNIQNPKIINNTIQFSRVESPKAENERIDPRELSIFNVKYVTTLRPNYTQRIANHAFTHPVRVGVDFISKR